MRDLLVRWRVGGGAAPLALGQGRPCHTRLPPEKAGSRLAPFRRAAVTPDRAPPPSGAMARSLVWGYRAIVGPRAALGTVPNLIDVRQCDRAEIHPLCFHGC